MIRDNKVLRNLVRKKILSFFCDYVDVLQYRNVLRDVEDFLLPSLLYFFYSKHSDLPVGFDQYLKELDLHNSNFEYITNRIKTLLNCYKDIDGEPLGDIHPNESTKFQDGNKVVYKDLPDYGDLIAVLSSKVFDDYKSFFPKIIKHNNYCFRDYISADTETEKEETVEKYYYNLGKIIPFLLFIRSIDVNAENMIVHLPYPVFFDMETIFSGEFADKSKQYDLTKTGLIKMEDNDTSILTGGLHKRDSLLKPILCGSMRKPCIKWRCSSKGKSSNIPELKGHTVHPLDYINSIKGGYLETSQKIINNKEILLNIVKEAEANLRIILRPTRIYRFFILESCYPQIYLYQNINSFLKYKLSNCDLIYSIIDKNLLSYEVKALSNLQIPTFYSNLKDREILSSEGKVVAYWKYSQFDTWNQYLKDLNSEFFDKQLETLELSIKEQ